MNDLANKEAFETWYIENYHDGDIFPNNRILDFNSHDNEYRDSRLNMLWDSWQASSQRQGFKLVPLEPSDDTVKTIANYLCETRSGTALEMSKSTYKAMINAV